MAPPSSHLASIRCQDLLAGGAVPGLPRPRMSRLVPAKSALPSSGSSASSRPARSRRRNAALVAASSSSPFSFSPSEFPSSSGSTSGSTSAAAGPPTSSSSFITMEDEFRSSQRMAVGLLQRYRKVVNAGYKDNLKDFAIAGIAAYSQGWTEDGLRKELQVQLLPQEDRTSAEPLSDSMQEASSVSQQAEEVSPPEGSRNSVIEPAGSEQQLRQGDAGQGAAEMDGVKKPSAAPEGPASPAAVAATRHEVDECLLWLCIVFVTLRCIPQSVVRRWSTASPVSSDSMLQWKGFCSIIANAYYTQGMAWYSIQRLQMEQVAATGRAEPAVVVADRMRLVFTTLEVVDPRWGGLKDFPTL